MGEIVEFAWKNSIQLIVDHRQSYFVKIQDAEERWQLFHDLAKDKREFIAKSIAPLSDIYTLKAVGFEDNRLEVLIKSGPNELPQDNIFVIQFQVGSEKYLSQANFKASSTDKTVLFINTDTDVFHLQRRETYRLRIPDSYKASLEVLEVNGQTKKLHFNLVDVSGGGCQIVFDPKQAELKVGDQFSAKLVLGRREPFEVLCKVRHMRKAALPTKSDSVAAGIQFHEISEKDKNKIIALVMDLYREIFRKFV